MRLTATDALAIADLARLRIDQHTAEHLATQMTQILDYMDTLAEVDTHETEPLYSPAAHASVLRPDETHPSPSREAILANAPATDGVYFLVPRVIA